MLNRFLFTRQVMLLLTGLLSLPVTLLQAAAYTWSGSVSTAWNTAANWTPNGIPAATDEVTIVASANAPQLGVNTTVTDFAINSGSLDLNGFTLTLTGSVYIRSGIITGSNGSHLIVNSPASKGTLFGTASAPRMRINVQVTVTSGYISAQRTDFYATTRLTKTGGFQNPNTSVGGNTFNGPTYLIGQGSYQINFGRVAPEVFNGPLYLKCVSQYLMVHNSTFNENVYLQGGGGAIYLGGTMAAAKKLLVDPATGFASGAVRLQGFVQQDATPLDITFTGNAALIPDVETVFRGEVKLAAPRLLLDGGTFYGPAYLTQTSATSSYGRGGNEFFDQVVITNTSSGVLSIGSSVANVYHREVTLNQTAASGSIYLSHSSSGNQFYGNLLLNIVSNGQVMLGNAGGTSRLAAGKQLRSTTSSLSGRLTIKGLHQQGDTPQQLTFSGSGALRLGAATVFEGTVSFQAPNLYLDGATFHQAATITKTGNYTSDCYGGNVFGGKVTIRNTASGNYPLNMATSVPDLITY